MKTLNADLLNHAERHDDSMRFVSFAKKVRPFIGWRAASKTVEQQGNKVGGHRVEAEQLETFFIEGVSLADLLAKYPTPVYVTSLGAIEARTRLYQSELKKYFPQSQVYYALKANWAAPVIKTVQTAGEGFDIVSIGELQHLLRLQVDPRTICFAGVGKTPAEVQAALEAGVGVLNVEHLAELALALQLLKKIPSHTKIALRLNPALEIETHPHLKTGALDSKFGMLGPAIEEFVVANDVLLRESSALGRPLVESIAGIHVHVGSQLLTGPIFSKLVRAVAVLSESLLQAGVRVSHLDFGGGLGVASTGVPDSGQDVVDHVSCLHLALRAVCSENKVLRELWGQNFENVQICLEPGRSIVASSTIFATRVLYTRQNSAAHRFAYVDGGMNDFPRPAIYGAQHDVVVAEQARHSRAGDSIASAWSPVIAGGKGLQIVGPVCESGDVLRKDAELGDVAVGDTLVFLEAGAYCRSMASEYNLRKLPASIFVRGNHVIEDV